MLFLFMCLAFSLFCMMLRSPRQVLAALAVLTLMSIFAQDSNAQLFGRRRGGGGMGNASQICDMSRVNQVVPPSACANGACNAQVAPAPAAPPAPVPDAVPTAFTRRSRKANRAGRHSFDVPFEAPTAIARR
jgi:hypothetical protein